MALDKKHIGRTYGPTVYEVGAEKMREFAYAVAGGVPSLGFTGGGAPAGLHPLFHDREAAAAGPFQSIVAFPSFCVVFAIAPFGMAVTDPELNLNLLMLVHGEQDFELFGPIQPGDVMTSVGTVSDIYSKAGMDFLVVTTESTNQTGKLVVRGIWTAVIRH